MLEESAVTFASQWAASVAADSYLDGTGVGLFLTTRRTALDRRGAVSRRPRSDGSERAGRLASGHSLRAGHCASPASGSPLGVFRSAPRLAIPQSSEVVRGKGAKGVRIRSRLIFRVSPANNGAGLTVRAGASAPPLPSRGRLRPTPKEGFEAPSPGSRQSSRSSR